MIEQTEAKKSFIYGEPRTATESDVKARWSGGVPGEHFRCAFCGYRFQIGDYWRCQYTNSTPGAYGNPLVCQRCDAEPQELIANWKQMHAEAQNKFWWFTQR